MAINVGSFLAPKNSNTWFIVEDKFIKGGLQVVANVAERDAINPVNLKAGMLVVTQDDNKIWQLSADTLAWPEFKPGGGSERQVAFFPVIDVPPGGVVDFNLPLGKTVIVHSLRVEDVCMVQAFETAARTDTNPYTFIATSDHLTDDGSTLMSDGTILRGRKYTILANRETTPSIDQYFRVGNLSSSIPLTTILYVDYLAIE